MKNIKIGFMGIFIQAMTLRVTWASSKNLGYRSRIKPAYSQKANTGCPLEYVR
ncbi:MAG: hypothetical protein HN722_04225 [Nitrospina sp.]|nr:hypothetical protein [Nitrospina sp.]